MQRYHATSALS